MNDSEVTDFTGATKIFLTLIKKACYNEKQKINA